MIVPPALLSRGQSEPLGESNVFLRLLLETANMRVFGRRQSAFAPRPWGNADELLKGAIEGRLGFIADCSRRARDAESRLLQQSTRELKAPACEIVQRGDADVFGKALSENGTREAGFARQPVQGPALGRARMKEPQRFADMRISQARQPPAGLAGRVSM